MDTLLGIHFSEMDHFPRNRMSLTYMVYNFNPHQHAKWHLVLGGIVRIKKNNIPLTCIKMSKNSFFSHYSDFQDMKIMNHDLQTPGENFPRNYIRKRQFYNYRRRFPSTNVRGPLFNLDCRKRIIGPWNLVINF